MFNGCTEKWVGQLKKAEKLKYKEEHRKSEFTGEVEKKYVYITILHMTIVQYIQYTCNLKVKLRARSAKNFVMDYFLNEIALKEVLRKMRGPFKYVTSFLRRQDRFR